ncbi:MAG TPA: hypothetical protein VEA59_02670 [Patescibacteria group bacterium]|nr:hypothetical protein [Patescibacteria group bacterium]
MEKYYPVFLFIALLMLAIGYLAIRKEKRRLNTLARYHKRLPILMGHDQFYGKFDLRSLDQGQTWLAVQTSEDQTVTVLGYAEQIYPGLLARALQNRLFVNLPIEFYEQNYKRRCGGTVGYGSYNLESFDGGKTWFAIKWTDDWQCIYLGAAETVYPGLLARLQGFDALIEHVEKHGPITLAGHGAAKDLQVLTGAGFTVAAK